MLKLYCPAHKHTETAEFGPKQNMFTLECGAERTASLPQSGSVGLDQYKTRFKEFATAFPLVKVEPMSEPLPA